MMNNLQDI